MRVSETTMAGRDGMVPAGLATVKKAFDAGTHRMIPPQETLERVTPLMPVMGITRIANVTGLDTIGIPVVMVSRPNSRSVSVSQGKGATLEAAKASGLMESVESYHAERISLPLMLGSYEDIRYTHKVVDVDRLPHLTDSLYTPHTQLLWIEGKDLLSNHGLWVPYEMVHLDYTLPLPTGHGCFVPSSNGLASGNHLYEAISHGISEVVERDATTLWHLLDSEEQERTRINLDTVDDPSCRELLEKYSNAGVLVAVWEITSDIGMPAFLCRILQEAPPPYNDYRPASGMGCHPSRKIALSRALNEAAQSRLTFISGARDDLWRSDYDSFLDPATHKIWLSYMESTWQGRNFQDAPTWDTTSFEDDIAWELERLKSVGIDQVVAVDLTKSEFGIPVVRVIIPGLEGMDHSPKYVPGERARKLLKRGT
jgi:ribosomal protein S12 methylthiotransferase accessory factor